MDALLIEIDSIDTEMRNLSRKLLRSKHEFLRGRGWEIEKEMIGPIVTYIYSKDDETLICEDEALDREFVTIAKPVVQKQA